MKILIYTILTMMLADTALAGGMGRSQVALARKTLLAQISELPSPHGFREIESIKFVRSGIDRNEYYPVKAEVDYGGRHRFDCEILVKTTWASGPKLLGFQLVGEELCTKIPYR